MFPEYSVDINHDVSYIPPHAQATFVAKSGSRYINDLMYNVPIRSSVGFNR